MNHPRILIAGVGNIFLGDDAFGVEVVRRIAQRTLPAAVRVIDFGIKGIDLAYTLLEDYDGAILVDAVSRGGESGMLYVLEPDLDNMENTGAGGRVVEAHGMDPVEVLRLVRILGGPLPTIRVVGCEPATFASADGVIHPRKRRPRGRGLGGVIPRESLTLIFPNLPKIKYYPGNKEGHTKPEASARGPGCIPR